ncbi:MULTISPECIES: CNP1-like family protein [Thiohalobacter]|uniref:CNP1-like family protein n=1 Tax=Thiohalobacter TaxID=1273155 RepID=UPI0012FE1AB5|nr:MULTISPECIES: CNP1-like family protein [Thiohalobacter]
MNSHRIPRIARRAAAVLALFLPGIFVTAQAVDEDVYPQHQYVEPDEDQEWKELEVRLPPFPEADQFRALPSQLPNTSLELQLDPDSIRVDEDGVIRYLLRIQSPSGAGNLFYEGLRCNTAQYRTYAYATSAERWQRMRGDDWQALDAGGTTRFRRFLYRHYFCEPGVGYLSEDEIRKRVRYGAPLFYDDP